EWWGGPDTSGAPTVQTRIGRSSAAEKSRGPSADPHHESPHPRPRYTPRGLAKNSLRHRVTARRWERDTPRLANPEHHPFRYSSFLHPRLVVSIQSRPQGREKGVTPTQSRNSLASNHPWHHACVGSKAGTRFDVSPELPKTQGLMRRWQTTRNRARHQPVGA